MSDNRRDPFDDDELVWYYPWPEIEELDSATVAVFKVLSVWIEPFKKIEYGEDGIDWGTPVENLRLFESQAPIVQECMARVNLAFSAMWTFLEHEIEKFEELDE